MVCGVLGVVWGVSTKRLIYRQIKSQTDHITLQNDLLELEKWADKWGMRFNAKKCYILSINNLSSNFYSLGNHILKQVDENPYLGLTITENLKWSSHITKITKKAYSTVGFLRRNLKMCPTDCRKTAYISLVRSVLDYGSIIWDPYLRRDIEKLERVQKQAAHFINGDYHSREEGSVPKMLETLELETLERRRSSCRLYFLFKVVEVLVPAINPEAFLKHQKPKRQIKPKQFTGYKSSNLVEKHSVNNDRAFTIEQCKSEQLKTLFS